MPELTTEENEFAERLLIVIRTHDRDKELKIALIKAIKENGWRKVEL